MSSIKIIKGLRLILLVKVLAVYECEEYSAFGVLCRIFLTVKNSKAEAGLVALPFLL